MVPGKAAGTARKAGREAGGGAAPCARYESLDALRGFAMVWMTVFHFCFDLSHLGWWSQNFRTDPFWTTQRTAIVSLFLLCAGVSQAVAMHQGQRWSRFAVRCAQIAACAMVVSLGSYWMFPRSYIHFGVLHGMVVMLIIARWTAGWGRGLWLAGAAALALPWAMQWVWPWLPSEVTAAFNGRALNWMGLVSRKPFTEDYVPILPWMGVVWWGMALGQHWMRRGGGPLGWRCPRPLSALAVLGRWSLSYYMLHQPVMIGALMGLGWWMAA